MGKHRTIDTRLQELQAQMVALQVKANKDAVAQNPTVRSIDGEIDDLNKSALKWKRWAKDADQKIVDFENRVSEWEHRRDEASGWLDNYSDALTDLKSRRDEAAKEALGDIEKAVQDI